MNDISKRTLASPKKGKADKVSPFGQPKNCPSGVLLTDGGVSIMETLAALLVLSVTLVSLMIMVQYARSAAEVSYQDRYVLLRLDGEIQVLRYAFNKYDKFGRNLSENSTPPPVTIYIPNPTGEDEREDRKIPVRINFSRRTELDTTAGPNIKYIILNAVAEWEERIGMIEGRQSTTPKRRYIELREDFYFEDLL